MILKDRQLILVLVFFFLTTVTDSNAQEKTLQYNIGLTNTFSIKKEQPFWIYANRWGAVDPMNANLFVSSKVFIPFEVSQENKFDYSIGAEWTGRPTRNSTSYFSQIYLKFKYGPFLFQSGRFKEKTGEVYQPLTMGSMGISGNSVPIPKIKIGIPSYVPLPFTRDYLKVKGAIGHGWFEENRFVEHPWLHEKYGYLLIGDPLPVKLEAGLMHMAEWGGTHPNLGQLPNTINDFLRVFSAVGGDPDAPYGERIYMLGNHFGYWDFGFRVDLNRFEIHGYRQFYLEDKQGLKFKSAKDGLSGLAIEFKQTRPIIKGMLMEFLYTKWQNGPIPDDGERGGSGGWKNNYGHYLYRKGWNYFGQTVGTPLLFIYSDEKREAGEPLGGNDWYWENNRVVATHFGVHGFLNSSTIWKFIATYSRNYGTYNERYISLYTGRFFENPQLRPEPLEYNYLPPPHQWSFLTEVAGPLPFELPIHFKASLAVDTGELYPDNIGVLLSLSWNGSFDL